MSTTCLEPQPLVEALIAGLGVARQNLDAKCEAALRAVGSRAVPYLRAAAEASTRSRKRIETLASSIGDIQDFNPNASNLARKALLAAATVQTAQESPSLIPALQLFGSTVTGTLIREALVNRNKPSDCLRILEVVEQLGGPSEVDGQFEAAMLATSKNPAVRDKALKLFCLPQAKRRADEAGVSARGPNAR